MAYRTAPWFVTHVFNPLAMKFGIGGSLVLEVARRRSGGVQRIPVLLLELDGHRYLVSPRGNTQWVRNLRVSGECRVGRSGALTAYRAGEVDVADRGPILAEYRVLAGKAVRSHFEALPDDADHPVFELTPA